MKKKNVKMISMALIALFMFVNNNQSKASEFEQHQDTKKSVKKSVKNMNKSFKKQSKQYKAEGYSVEMGAPAVEFQLRHSFEKEYAVDEAGNMLYVIGVGTAKSGIQNVSRMHAVSNAVNNACVLMESKVMGMIETDYNNKLYSKDEYENLSKMKGVFTTLLAHKLPIGVPNIVLVKKDRNYYAYNVRIAYSLQTIKEDINKVMRDILEKENDDLRLKFEKITGLDRLGTPNN